MLLEVIATIVNDGSSSSSSSSRPPLPAIREQLRMEEDSDTVRTLHHTIQMTARQRLLSRINGNGNGNVNGNVNGNGNENERRGSSTGDHDVVVQILDEAVVQYDVEARLSVNGTALRADDDASISSLRHLVRRNDNATTSPHTHAATTTTSANTSTNNNAATLVVVVDCQLTVVEPPSVTRSPRLLRLGPLWGPEEGGTLLRLHGEGFLSPLLQRRMGEVTDSSTSSNNRSVLHVRFGSSVSVPCEQINDTTLCCLSPQHPPGIVKVSLVRCGISHNNNNNNNNQLTGGRIRQEEELDETTFEYVRMGAAFDAIFATTNSYCPLRSQQQQQQKQDQNNDKHTTNNGVDTNDDNDIVPDAVPKNSRLE